MALTITNSVNGETNATAASYNTANISPSAGSLLIGVFSFRAADLASMATETLRVGNGAGSLNGTFIQLDTSRFYGGSNQFGIACFKATSAAWGTAQPITMDCVSGRSLDRGQWAWVEIAGYDTTTPVIQTVPAAGAAGTLQPSLASFSFVGNFTLLLACSTGIDDPTWTIESSYTRLSTVGAVNRYSAYININDTTPSVTYTATSAPVQGFGLEIAVARETTYRIPFNMNKGPNQNQWVKGNTNNMRIK
jgi:hypothetical protein